VLSRHEEKKLRELLRQSFLEDHPNPERRDCPGSDILEAIASGKITLEEAVPWIHHFASCSPCTREFREFRKVRRRQRLPRIAGLAVGILMAAGVLARFRPLTKKELSGNPPI